MEFPFNHSTVARYQGFLFLKQPNHTWLIRPERSPMLLLPFRTHSCSLSEAKKILTQKLSESTDIHLAA